MVELIADSSPVAPLGSLILKWLDVKGGSVEGSAVEIFEMLKDWNNGNLSNYSRSASHFGHQLFRLRELPDWKSNITKSAPRRGVNRQKQTVWQITAGDRVG